MTAVMDKAQLEEERASLIGKRASLKRHLDAHDDKIQAAAEKQLKADTDEEADRLITLLLRFGLEPNLEFKLVKVSWMLDVSLDTGFSSYTKGTFSIKANLEICALLTERENLQADHKDLDRELMDVQKALQSLDMEQG